MLFQTNISIYKVQEDLTTFVSYFTVNLHLTETPSSILTNSIAMFFVGVVVTLALVLVVFVSIWFYKRRRQTQKLSTGGLEVDIIEMQNDTAPDPSPNNQVYITWNIL